MKQGPFTKIALILALLVGACALWAQEPDAPMPPPPPPDGQFFFVSGGPMGGHVKPVKGAPFSAQATTQTTQVLADGNQINRTETAQIARDSSGRTRRDATLARIGPWSSAGTPREIINLTDPVAGVNYMLDVTEKTAMKMPFHDSHDRMYGPGEPEGPVLRWKEKSEAGQSAAQHTKESLGTQTRAGLSVEGTRVTETIAAGAVGNQNPIVIVSERWYSSDLQEVVYSKHSDPRFGTTIYQLANVNRGEPDASLFQVPADYTVKEGPPHGPKSFMIVKPH